MSPVRCQASAFILGNQWVAVLLIRPQNVGSRAGDDITTSKYESDSVASRSIHRANACQQQEDGNKFKG